MAAWSRRKLLRTAVAPLVTLPATGCLSLPSVYTFKLTMVAEVGGMLHAATSVFFDRAEEPIITRLLNPASPWIVSVKGASPILSLPGLGTLFSLLRKSQELLDDGGYSRSVLAMPLNILQATEKCNQSCGSAQQNRRYQDPVFWLDRARNNLNVPTLVPDLICPQLVWLPEGEGLESGVITIPERIVSASHNTISAVSFYVQSLNDTSATFSSDQGRWRDQAPEGFRGRYPMSRSQLFCDHWQSD